MNIKEIEDKISFKVQEDSNGIVTVCANLNIVAVLNLEKRRYSPEQFKDALEHAKSHTKEMLLRSLYERPNNEIYEAMMEVMTEVHPAAIGLNFNKCKERLFTAIMRRPPEESELYGVRVDSDKGSKS